MRGDFSRLPFAWDDRYTSVRQQQGRVTLDSDWNEQASIREHLERAYLKDIIGGTASPSSEGFAVVDRASTLHLTAGRIYVGGFRCELRNGVPIEQLLGTTISPSAERTDLVYLNVWERHVTAVDNPALLEVALSGADTTTRLEVAWKIELLEDVGEASSDDATALMPQPPGGIMSAAAPNGYEGLENQLYRVEIHDSGTAGAATFKWSRDNASTVFPIKGFLTASSVSLSPRPDAESSLAAGDWVEVSGVQSELADSGTLAEVIELRDDACVLDRDVSRHGSETHPRLRRWDQRSGPVALTTKWVELEAGIKIRFSEGGYRTGDYWTIPARPATHAIEWPGDRPPDGIERRFAPLALVKWHRLGDTWDPEIQDCRRMFTALTDLHEELSRLRHEVLQLRKRVDGV